jgi:hypothetical protein
MAPSYCRADIAGVEIESNPSPLVQ